MKLLLLTLMLSGSACVHTSLDDTYGLNFNAVFAAQTAQRTSREASPMKGEEGRRIISAYYESLAGDPQGGGGGGGSGGGGGGSTTSHGPPPTSFQIKAH